jgi:hypothetical protein
LPHTRYAAESHHESTRVADVVNHFDGAPGGSSTSNQTRPACLCS